MPSQPTCFFHYYLLGLYIGLVLKFDNIDSLYVINQKLFVLFCPLSLALKCSMYSQHVVNCDLSQHAGIRKLGYNIVSRYLWYNNNIEF